MSRTSLTTKPAWGEVEGYTYEELMVYGWLPQIFSLIRILLLKDKEWQEITHLMGHFSICVLTWTTAENKWRKHTTNLGTHLNAFLLRDFFKHPE